MKLFLVLDIGLGSTNPCLNCKYLINSWKIKKHVYVFCKGISYLNFKEFSKTLYWYESCDQHPKMFFEGIEFFKTDFKKKLLWNEKCRAIPPSWDLWGANVYGKIWLENSRIIYFYVVKKLQKENRPSFHYITFY